MGNEFVNLLMARLGRADTVALMEGRLLLEASGITGDVEAILDHRAPIRLAEIARNDSKYAHRLLR